MVRTTTIKTITIIIIMELETDITTEDIRALKAIVVVEKMYQVTISEEYPRERSTTITVLLSLSMISLK